MINHFNFKQMGDNLFLVTNDFGRSLFLDSIEFSRFLKEDFIQSDPLYHKLHENYFILEPMELFSDKVTGQLRRMKDYVFRATSLHIFVVTTACNLRCVYCQAQDERNTHKGLMDASTACKAVDVALQSPAQQLTFEFQGGEPLLNFPVIRTIVEHTNQHKGDKDIDFTVVSNLSLLTPEIANFFGENKVTVCTSIDGPESLHNRNRTAPVSTNGSFSFSVSGIELLRKTGFTNIGAIQTTTRYSLPYAREIVREYLRLGISGIFLRPLTPLGFASTQWTEIGYTAEEWLEFYRTAFDEILKINLSGIFFPEQHASIFLRKILAGYAENYMELRSPCGAGVGQLAYYYDGSVYTCDEARMVSESGNQAFRLGNVFDNSYQDIISSTACRATCTASLLESIPGCCDCVYQPYCGVCPVVTYASEGDLFPSSPHRYRCCVYQGILDHLFSLLQKDDKSIMQVFYSWIGDDSYEGYKERA